MIAEGFRLFRGFASDIELDEVRAAIAWQSRTIRMFGREVAQPRLTAWYGDEAYTYSGQRHDPAPMPTILAVLRSRLEGAIGPSQPYGVIFNSVLGNLYRDGSDSVAWHADDEPELGPEPLIASLSLGASRRFAIRRNADRARFDLELAHGDLVVMSGRSQADYQHAIPKLRPCGPRINLTYRNIRTS